jgi:predicted transposase YbfD/YdcC
VAWTQSVAQLSNGEVVAIDGKTLRRSHDRRRGQRPLHMVSAWASANRLSLGQLSTPEKSNEITAIPKLLALLELKGCIVSIDAMGCQTAITTAVIAQGADYVLAVKDNQPELHAAIQDYFETARDDDFSNIRADRHDDTDAGHGRCEVRRCRLVTDLRTLPDPQRWAGLRGIARVESERHQGAQISYETRYYITSLSGSARQVADAVRAHWGVENGLHWVLDVTFRENESRIRRDHTPANFNTLRQFARNLLERCTSPDSIKRRRFKAALDDAFRAKVVFGA